LHARPARVKQRSQVTNPSRRRLLKWGIAGSALLGGGTFIYRSVGRFGPPGPGLMLFDAHEFAVLEAVCEGFFPGPPEWPLTAAEAETAKFVDRYVSRLYPDGQLLFRALMRTLNLSTVLTHGRTFRYLSVADRAEVLEGWAKSSLYARRSANQSMSLIIKMGYFEHPKVREAGGFVEGCPISQEGRPQGA
jgi:hypothetical protein